MIVSPPSTIKVWPVTNEASSEARNRTAAAISSGVPMRLKRDGGIVHPPSALSAADNSSSFSVAIQPGLTQLTRIPWGAPSAANERVKASTAALSMP